MKWVYF